MRRIFVLVIALVLAMPIAAVSGQPQGPVDRAKDWMDPSCYDGIGATYTLAQDEAAQADGTADDFTQRTAACLAHTIFFVGQCSPPIERQRAQEQAVIICIALMSNNRRSDDIVLSTDDFSLLSNTEEYPVDADLSALVLPDFDIASQPVTVPPDSDHLFAVAFTLPADVAGEDLVLQWSGVGPMESTKGELPGLQLLVHEREPELRDIIPGIESAVPSAEPDAQTSPEVLRFSGASDDVIGPLDLDAGLYRVSATYDGEGNFAVWAMQTGGSSDLLFNEIGDYRGEDTFTVEAGGAVVLEVEGVGVWEIAVERLM